MSAADRLTDILSGERAANLDESLLLLAASRPGGTPDIGIGMTTLDELAASCPDPTVDALIRHVYVGEGFAGDHEDFHDPRNSYLDQVLHRRRGMPITLAVVLLEVGRRVGVELVGVGMPGHFLVRERDDRDGFIDPFRDGTRISAAACEARFRTMHGPDADFHPSYLEPVPTRSIVLRVLNNLTVSFRNRNPRDLDWLLDIRVPLPGAPPELRALAELCELRGRYDDAATLLERAVADGTDSAIVTQVRDRARRLRARLN